MSTLRRRVMVSALWSTGGAVAIRVGSLLTGIVAARLLAPEQFGLFAVALVVLTFVGSFADMGVGTAVIRARSEELDRVAPTAVTLALVNFTGLGLLLAVTAPWVASAFGAPEAESALQVLSLYLVLCGPAAVPVGILVRDFQQGRRVVFDVLGLLTSSAVLVVMALDGWGALALAWSRVAGQLVVVMALLVTARRRYRPGWIRSSAGEILTLGVPLVGATLVTSALAAVDVFVISRLLGPHEAGVYNLAATVGAWPLGIFLPVLVSVGLPLFARLRDDPHVVGRLLASCLDMVAGVFWPVSALLAALAGPLVQVLYGTKWSASAAILAVIALAKAFEVVMALLADVMVAGGLARAYLRSQVLRLALVLPLAWWAVPQWGSVAAAWVSVVVLALVVVPVNLRTCSMMTDVAWPRLFAHTWYPVLAAGAAGVTAHLVATQFDAAWSALLAGGSAGGLLYLVLTLRWGLRAYQRTKQLGGAPEAGSEAGSPSSGEGRGAEGAQVTASVPPVTRRPRPGAHRATKA